MHPLGKEIMQSHLKRGAKTYEAPDHHHASKPVSFVVFFLHEDVTPWGFLLQHYNSCVSGCLITLKSTVVRQETRRRRTRVPLCNLRPQVQP